MDWIQGNALYTLVILCTRVGTPTQDELIMPASSPPIAMQGPPESPESIALSAYVACWESLYLRVNPWISQP